MAKNPSSNSSLPRKTERILPCLAYKTFRFGCKNLTSRVSKAFFCPCNPFPCLTFSNIKLLCPSFSPPFFACPLNRDKKREGVKSQKAALGQSSKKVWKKEMGKFDQFSFLFSFCPGQCREKLTQTCPRSLLPFCIFPAPPSIYYSALLTVRLAPSQFITRFC